MPKIRITEKDSTGVIQNNRVSHVVYIPGTASSTKTKPTLCRSEDELDAMLIDKTTLSYRLAKHLINLGMDVLYQGIVVTAPESEGGSPTIAFDWTSIKDKSLYDIRFITAGEFAGITGVNQAMISVAASRGDCVALCDHEQIVTPIESQTQVEAIRSVFNSLTDGKYAAGFTPWFKTTNADLVAGSATEATIPASFGYLFSYAKSLRAGNGEWLAVAGSSRGIIDELSGVLHEYTTSECEILQARSETVEVELDDSTDNVGVAINPIAYVRPFGYILWGNRTLNKNDAGLKTTAESFLNIRQLVTTIKKKLYDAARRYTFEQNSDVLWINFTNQITPTLDEMQAGNGILGYRWEKLPTQAKARIKARLTVVPVEAVEDFDIDILLSDSLEVTE